MSRGYKFCKINEMSIQNISDRRHMTYKYYPDQPMHICERNKYMTIAKNPELINVLDRNKNHPFIRR